METNCPWLWSGRESTDCHGERVRFRQKKESQIPPISSSLGENQLHCNKYPDSFILQWGGSFWIIWFTSPSFPIMSLTQSKTVRGKKKNQVPMTQPYLRKWISYSLVRLTMLMIESCSFWKPWSTSSLTNSSRSTVGSYPMLCTVSPWFQ